MAGKTPFIKLISTLGSRPHARARIFGSSKHPAIHGTVYFYQTKWGVLVAAEVSGLPAPVGRCTSGIFGFHIHSGSRCTGNTSDLFADTLSHYDPENCPHPYHAGDLPPLFGNHGYAFQVFLTDRFSVREIINRTVVIHSEPDDFTSQPSGHSGEKIACGEIKAQGRGGAVD